MKFLGILAVVTVAAAAVFSGVHNPGDIVEIGSNDGDGEIRMFDANSDPTGTAAVVRRRTSQTLGEFNNTLAIGFDETAFAPQWMLNMEQLFPPLGPELQLNYKSGSVSGRPFALYVDRDTHRVAANLRNARRFTVYDDWAATKRTLDVSPMQLEYQSRNSSSGTLFLFRAADTPGQNAFIGLHRDQAVSLSSWEVDPADETSTAVNSPALVLRGSKFQDGKATPAAASLSFKAGKRLMIQSGARRISYDSEDGQVILDGRLKINPGVTSNSPLVDFLNGSVRADGSLEPAFLSDDEAKPGSVFYSVDRQKLVFKDYSGTIRELY